MPHTYSDKMAVKSEVIVLDVLHKNETKSSEHGAHNEGDGLIPRSIIQPRC